jgi:hydrophobe/amphiphile efflux-3 (HAE3) family protein
VTDDAAPSVGRLRRVFAAVGRVLAARPLVALALAVLLVGVAFGGATQIRSVTGNEAFVADEPTLEAYQESFDRGVAAVLVRGDLTAPATMRAIDRFDRRMTGVEDVAVVNTPADRLRERYGRIPGSRTAIERVVDPGESTVLSVVLDTDLEQEAGRAVYDRAVEAREWAAFPAGAAVTITGQPAFSAQLSAAIQSSTQQLLGTAVGLMTLALFFLFRGVRLRLLPIVAVFVGVVYTFGAIGYAGVPNSTLTSAVFPILIGLGIDYSVQFHQRYAEELERAPPVAALPRAMAGVGPAVLVAMLAAALGFGATWISTRDSPAFVWFAQTSMFGVLLTYLTATIVLVPTITLVAKWRGWGGAGGADPRTGGVARPPATDGGTVRSDTGDDDVGRVSRALGSIAAATGRRPALVLGVAGLLFVGGLYAGTTLDTLADPEEFTPDDLPALLDLQQFRDATGGGTSVRYDVLVTGSRLRDPETLRWMESVRETASSTPLVRDVETPAAAVRRVNGGALPRTEAGVERALDRLPPEQRARFYADGRAHLIVIGQRDLTPEQLLSMIGNVEDAIALSRPPPGVEAELTGTAVVSTPSIQEQIASRDTTTLLGAAFVFGLLLLYYRDPVRATAPLVPMVFVVGWQSLYMAAANVKVSPLGASLGALTIGIGAEYTVIVMERYYEEKARGAAPLNAIRTAGERVGTAISVSGLTTVFGFSALTLSPFPILADFGALTVGVIALTLVAALTVLPPTLILLDEGAAATGRLLDGADDNGHAAGGGTG